MLPITDGYLSTIIDYLPTLSQYVIPESQAWCFNHIWDLSYMFLIFKMVIMQCSIVIVNK